MYKPGGPELLLYRRASAHHTPNCPTAGQTTPKPGHLRAEKSRPAKSFVHLDAFAGNMLAEGSVVSAVTGFGVTAEAGDARLDPLTAPVYLSAPEITRQPLPGTSRWR